MSGTHCRDAKEAAEKAAAEAAAAEAKRTTRKQGKNFALMSFGEARLTWTFSGFRSGFAEAAWLVGCLGVGVAGTTHAVLRLQHRLHGFVAQTIDWHVPM